MPFFSRVMRFVRSPALPNTGSVARDLLASERTFLAWARTGLGFIALGVALEKVEALAALSPTLLHLQDSRTKLAAGVLVGAGECEVSSLGDLRKLLRAVVVAWGLRLMFCVSQEACALVMARSDTSLP